MTMTLTQNKRSNEEVLYLWCMVTEGGIYFLLIFTGCVILSKWVTAGFYSVFFDL